MNVAEERAFLRELARSGNVAFACLAAGVTWKAAVEHRDEYPEFERDWRDAVETARTHVPPPL